MGTPRPRGGLPSGLPRANFRGSTDKGCPGLRPQHSRVPQREIPTRIERNPLAAPRYQPAGVSPRMYEQGSSSGTMRSEMPVRRNVTNINVGGQQIVQTNVLDAGPSAASGAIRKVPSRTTTVKKTNRVGNKTVSETTSTRVEQVPMGKYHIPMRDGPRTKEGKFTQFGSPFDLRSQLDTNPQKYSRPNVMILPGRDDVQDYRRLMQQPGYKDIKSGMVIRSDPRSGYSPRYTPHRDDSVLNRRVDDTIVGDDWEDDNFESQMQTQLLRSVAKSPKKHLQAVGTRQLRTSPPTIMTEHGPAQAMTQVITTDTVQTMRGQPEIVGHQMVGIKTISPQHATKAEVSVQKISPGKGKGTRNEVVKVVSSVTVGRGVKQSSKTVIYETDADSMAQGQDRPPSHSFRDVAKMIAEESAIVDRTKHLAPPDLKSSEPDTYTIRKRVDTLNLNEQSVAFLQKQVSNAEALHEDLEEPSPEIIANMMNTEERGLDMSSAPTNVYNYLFADPHAEQTVEVSSAAPAPLHDVVVPGPMPNQIFEASRDPEMINMSHMAEPTGGPCNQPNESVYVSNVGPEPITSRNCARKGSRKKKTALLLEEIPPWGIHDVEPVVDLVGGEPHLFGKKEQGVDFTLSEDQNATEDGIEYILAANEPTCYSKVQLRGSQYPSWFPGYYLALPSIPQCITIAKSPSRVFAAAWKATQPDIFADESLIIA